MEWFDVISLWSSYKTMWIVSLEDYSFVGYCKPLPNVFTDSKRLAANTPARIEVLEGKLINVTANESKARLKCGRPVGAKERNPRKRKTSRSPWRGYTHETGNKLIILSKIVHNISWE